jgi:hypothetical protein
MIIGVRIGSGRPGQRAILMGAPSTHLQHSGMPEGAALARLSAARHRLCREIAVMAAASCCIMAAPAAGTDPAAARAAAGRTAAACAGG